MKAAGASKDEIKSAVEALNALKLELAEKVCPSEAHTHVKTPKAAPKKEFNRASFEDLLKRRFFYAPSFEIYGGEKLNTSFPTMVWVV